MSGVSTARFYPIRARFYAQRLRTHLNTKDFSYFYKESISFSNAFDNAPTLKTLVLESGVNVGEPKVASYNQGHRLGLSDSEVLLNTNNLVKTL